MAEVRRRLTGAGYRADLVESAIERMLELGMLDDEAFARAWVESRDRARPRGERAIRTELMLKGVDRASIDLVLAERHEALATGGDVDDGAGGPGDSDEFNASAALSPDRISAERLIARHRRSLDRVPDPRQRRQRAYALLARNGFDPDICREMSTRALDRGDPGDAEVDGG